ncbi:hypothetical protein [Microbulbifer variabilis]|uniref:Uncharacterized protein n=1 Tax=Microbulbifer variabilis TaxID=266805 RepID=A0ABY4VB90_9GAMM|nr:hypothetical protein [Microbulbifer variabilis]USD20130.1 hypothetical protein MJO52_13690 [Microbulbifer variabilis]
MLKPLKKKKIEVHTETNVLQESDFILNEITKVDGAGIVTTTYEIRTPVGVTFTHRSKAAALTKLESLLQEQRFSNSGMSM